MLNLSGFLLDAVHEFVGDIKRHVHDMLFEKVELRSEGGEYGFKVEDGLFEGLMIRL